MRLVLIGTGPKMEQIRLLISDLEMDSRVTLTGRLPQAEVAKYLTAADIGVSPYCGRVEYSGLKLPDYKPADLAIIASG